MVASMHIGKSLTDAVTAQLGGVKPRR